MSTRSAIVLKLKNTYAGIYCHSDGYPEAPHGVGYHLLTYYNDAEKARQLIELGDISCLYPRLEPTDPSKHKFDGPREPGVTVAYMRDRGEKDCEAKVDRSLKKVLEAIDHQYAYVFENGAWTCNGEPLEAAVAAASANSS